MKTRLFNSTRSGYFALFVLVIAFQWGILCFIGYTYKPTYHLNNILSLTVRLRDFHAETNNMRKAFASSIENDANHRRVLRNSEETQGNFTRFKNQNSVEISWNEDYDASSEHVHIKNNIPAKLKDTRNEADDEPKADHVQYNKQEIIEMKSDSNSDNETDIIPYNNVDKRTSVYANSTGVKRTRAQWKDLIQKQNELYNYTLYGRAGTTTVHYYSAQVFSTNGIAGKWESVVLNGWEGQGSKKTPLNCCVKVKNSSIPIMLPVERNPWKVHDSMPVNAVQFTCMIPKKSSFLEPESVGLTLTVCKAVTQYIQLELVAPNESISTSSKFAICGKLVYGDYLAEKVFEWLEVNIAMGVDHISLYSYNVSKSIQKVLDYYEKQGRLKVKPFDFPMKSRFPRVIGQKYIMSYIDEQIALYDCVQRYRFYDYVAVIDVDEIIMPYITYTQAKNINYKNMMRRLLEKYPNAAGFTMMTSTFVLDWKPTHPQADYMIGQYTRALIPMWDRPKNIIIPSRVMLDTVWTHSYTPKKDYKKFSLSSKTVLLFHYRHCRTGKGSDKSCLTDEKRSTVVNTMKIFISTIRQRLDSNRRLIFN